MIQGLRIQVDETQIADFCRRNHILKMWFFGSVLRDDFLPDSDVDVLVEFDPDVRLSFWDVVGYAGHGPGDSGSHRGTQP